MNNERRVTVILTTHDMDDIEALCSRIMAIGKGTLLFDGSIGQLRNTVFPERIVKIDFSAPPRQLDYSIARLSVRRENHAEFRFNPLTTSAAELIEVISRENQIKDFIVENPPIEEIIAKMYRGFDL
jgi:ABC-2 type transport system ATP-binding protein